MEKYKRHRLLITNQDVRTTFGDCLATYQPHLKRLRSQNLISQQTGIDRWAVLKNAEDIQLAMNEYGVNAAELIEWIQNKEEVRKAIVSNWVSPKIDKKTA